MGTEAFWIPAVISAVGSGAQYVNTRNANNRAQDVEASNIMQQQQDQQKANAGAQALAKNIATSNPTALKNDATGQYVQELRRNAAGATSGTTGDDNLNGQSVSALAPNVNGSSRYKSDVNNSQGVVQGFGNSLANEMGTIDSTVRQRQNEGVAMQNYGTELNGLNQQSWGQNFVNQLRAQTAGQANPWVSMFSNLAQNYGKTASKAPGGPPAGETWTADMV